MLERLFLQAADWQQHTFRADRTIDLRWQPFLETLKSSPEIQTYILENMDEFWELLKSHHQDARYVLMAQVLAYHNKKFWELLKADQERSAIFLEEPFKEIIENQHAEKTKKNLDALKSLQKQYFKEFHEQNNKQAARDIIKVSLEIMLNECFLPNVSIVYYFLELDAPPWPIKKFLSMYDLMSVVKFYEQEVFDIVNETFTVYQDVLCAQMAKSQIAMPEEGYTKLSVEQKKLLTNEIKNLDIISTQMKNMRMAFNQDPKKYFSRMIQEIIKARKILYRSEDSEYQRLTNTLELLEKLSELYPGLILSHDPFGEVVLKQMKETECRAEWSTKIESYLERDFDGILMSTIFEKGMLENLYAPKDAISATAVMNSILAVAKIHDHWIGRPEAQTIPQKILNRLGEKHALSQKTDYLSRLEKLSPHKKIQFREASITSPALQNFMGKHHERLKSMGLVPLSYLAETVENLKHAFQEKNRAQAIYLTIRLGEEVQQRPNETKQHLASIQTPKEARQFLRELRALFRETRGNPAYQALQAAGRATLKLLRPPRLQGAVRRIIPRSLTSAQEGDRLILKNLADHHQARKEFESLIQTLNQKELMDHLQKLIDQYYGHRISFSEFETACNHRINDTQLPGFDQALKNLQGLDHLTQVCGTMFQNNLEDLRGAAPLFHLK